MWGTEGFFVGWVLRCVVCCGGGWKVSGRPDDRILGCVDGVVVDDAEMGEQVEGQCKPRTGGSYVGSKVNLREIYKAPSQQ